MEPTAAALIEPDECRQLEAALEALRLDPGTELQMAAAQVVLDLADLIGIRARYDSAIYGPIVRAGGLDSDEAGVS